MARGLLIVPPFIKYSAGPLLGPSLLHSAALNRGHTCSVIDLNASLIKQDKRVAFRESLFVGDHDKPTGANGESHLTRVEETFFRDNILSLDFQRHADKKKSVQFAFLDHATTKSAASRIASSTPFGMMAKSALAQHCGNNPAPHLVGVSLLHAGQVLPAAAISVLAREIFPDALIAWGGPHISGLGSALEKDLEQRAYAADVFVNGHAEKTFVDLLEMAASPDKLSKLKSTVSVMKGKQECSPLSPIFDNLDVYDRPLTLPAQSTLGCAYGRCKFCTYPAIEPVPTKLPLDVSVGSVVRTALQVGATKIAIKDSLATPTRLRQIGDCIAGQVEWSACSKLSKKLDVHLLQYLRDRGLVTLEVGLESLLPETQVRVDKIQPQHLYEKFVQDASTVENLTLVVNYMTGFPWEESTAATQKMNEARGILHKYMGSHGHFEHNSFELERLSSMMKNPSAFDIDSNKIRKWPWASVVQIK